ncbi:MAG: hypothetical protein ABIK09_04385 [Pseudomonadota bacterium]
MTLSEIPRVLLLEIIPDDPLRHYRAETFPFIAGLLEAAGVACEWAGLGVPLDMSFDYRLSDQDEAVVVDQVREFGPTHLVTNEHVVADQWARLEDACPRTRFIFRDRSTLIDLRELLADVIGVTSLPEELGGEDWVDRVTPRYLRRGVNPMAGTLNPCVQIIAGPRCAYSSPLSKNPAYEGVDVRGCHDGCAFCGRSWAPYPLRSFLDFAVRQVVQADRDLEAGHGRLQLDILSAAVWRELEAFVERLCAAGVRPFHLYFSARLDSVLEAAALIDRLLPRFAARGDGLTLYTSGVENFSAVENRRLNKGLDLETIAAGTERIQGWYEAWGDTFGSAAYRGLSTILFTPWTTLGDVRINLEHYASNPLIPASARLGSRLLLYPGRAVTRLAARDGLLLDDATDHAGTAGSKIQWDQEELPWRFLHPEVALLARFARRVSEYGGIPAEDPELRALDLWRSTLPEEAQDPLRLCAHALDVLEATPELAELRGLVAGIALRIDPDAPFRWPGDADWILVDDDLRARLARAFERVAAARPGLLQGAGFQGVELRGMDGERALRIAFVGPGPTPYRVWLQDAARCPRAYRVVPPVAVWVDKETPLVAPWMEALTDLVVRVALKVAEQQRCTP